MKKIHKLIALTALMSMFTNSAYTQEYYSEDGASAYNEGINVAHLTAFIPIVVLAGTAIWLSTYDQSHRHHSSKSHSSYSSHAHTGSSSHY